MCEAGQKTFKTNFTQLLILMSTETWCEHISVWPNLVPKDKMEVGGSGKFRKNSNISIKTLQKCPEMVFKKTAERVSKGICRNILINVSVFQKFLF